MALTHNSKLADQEPEWAKVDTSRLPAKAFAYAPADLTKSAWKFPHHWVKDGGALDDNGIYTSGNMYLHRGGLNAAWAAANGARSGQKADPKILAHLEAHRKAIGEEGDNTNSADGKKIYTMEMDRSAYTVDGRGATPEYMKFMYENTKRMMDTNGHVIPVHPGHEDELHPLPEASDGFVKTLGIKEHPNMPGEYIIYGDVELQGQLLKDYEAGKLPRRSVEWRDDYTMPDGKSAGPVIVGLSLNGTKQVALPDLKTAQTDKKGIITLVNSTMGAILKKLGISAKKLKELNMETKDLDENGLPKKMKDSENAGMPKKMKDAFDDAMALFQEGLMDVQNGLDKLTQAGAGFQGDEDAEDAAGQPEEGAGTDTGTGDGVGMGGDMPAGNTSTKSVGKPIKRNNTFESPRLKALEARVAAQQKELDDTKKANFRAEVDTHFNALQAQGKITTQEKATFETLVKTAGTLAAVATYEPRAAKIPPKSGILNTGSETTPEDEVALRKMYAANNMAKAQIDERIALLKTNPLNLRIAGEEAN